ncbi:uromodulin-like [Conger conger]|uniref:uromodulin-like n=1 Tax=Conger conger TaxID=82655 RepID=UPI002A59A2CD|nr:uromodulin-like [Conger conger]
MNPTCSCKAGFVGDGLSCYNSMACASGVCCASGYRWSSAEGCVDIDECASSEENCLSHLVCENTRGSFDCQTPPEPTRAPGAHHIAKRSVSPNSVLFRCGAVMCAAGHDCYTVNGVEQCRDPCTFNSRLDDPWRSTSNTGQNPLKCDNTVDWQGWYRLFLGADSVQMPENCVPVRRCGTHAPLWLPDGHPKPSDGIVLSRVCGHWSSDCCNFESNPIHIKACPRNYFVYKFVNPSACHLGYCADVNTAVCGSCRQDELCVSEDKVNWRCESQGRGPRAGGQVLGAPELVCGSSFIQVGLDSSVLAGKGLNASSAHLANFRCKALNETKGVVWFRIERKRESCGTQLRTNITHATYSNTLFVYPVTIGNITFSIPEKIPFSCVYPLHTETSLDVAIRPQLSLEGAVVRAGSRPNAVMSLYRNADYTDPYSSGRVLLPLGSALYVGVSAEEAASDRFAVILESCYATPTADSDGPSRFSLIQNRCPSNRRLVRVEQSGPLLPGRFTALVTLFSTDYGTIFLHCSLSMCDPRQPTCTQKCKSRVSRSVSLKKSVTFGPITWEKTG